ncbi:hypothetical protein F511_33616 [Dorcoceras hygrometricum]|uniref:Uncharacterized protein n=1 Tax=Dorcoceras hygrometricum TaxID=472368 RepID=A0A2Z7CXC3_9LAMI|nr:hypothetical protein F511_33616 [Dorcoceras hygrometricum]
MNCSKLISELNSSLVSDTCYELVSSVLIFVLSWINLDVVCWTSLGVPYCSNLDIFSIALSSLLTTRVRTASARFFSSQLICYSALIQLASNLLQLRPAHLIKSLET